MKKLNEKEWKAILVSEIFDNIETGKINNASIYTKTLNYGIEYIAATNRNNGCLYFLKETEEVKNKVQKGNCIGFIKDGDGSAGYAIYKKEKFASTVNVLYGYADWINSYTGNFFVASQDKIKLKYSHGYKRNIQHLKNDRIMLPIDTDGNPDYEYMENYAKNIRDNLLNRYKKFVEKQMKDLEYKEVPKLNKKEWKEFFFNDIFIMQRGHFSKKPEADNTKKIPFLGATDSNNGITCFVDKKNINSSKIFNKNAIAVTNNGSVGKAYYQDSEFTGSSDLTMLYLKNYEINKYIALFLIENIEKQGKSFEYSRKWSLKRMNKSKVLLPINSNGDPDYNYMEQYIKNVLLKKYNKYLKFIEKLKNNDK